MFIFQLIAEKKKERKPESSKQSFRTHKLFSNGEDSHREDLDFDFNPVNTSRQGHDPDLDMDVDFGEGQTDETHPVKGQCIIQKHNLHVKIVVHLCPL